MSSRVVTLFTDQKIGQKGSPSMFASIAAHFLTVGLLFVLMKIGVPHVVNKVPPEFSVVRVLTYNPPRQKAKAGSHGLHYHSHSERAKKSAAGAPHPQQRVLPPNPKIKTGAQTILQAHANKIPPPKNPVIPTVLLTAAHPKITHKIFTPRPHKNPAAPEPQLLTLPNAQIHVADIRLTATHFTTPHFMLPPSTTVPYQLKDPTPDAQIIETSSPTNHPPSPTRLLAISDLHSVKGTIAIPQTANEIQQTSAKGSASPGEEQFTPGTGLGTRKGLSLIPAALNSSGLTGQQAGAAADDNGTRSSQEMMKDLARNMAPEGSGGLTTASGHQVTQALAGIGSGTHITFTHLFKPETGHFGAVLMGDSPEADFPETADLWKGRNAYTVYINVGRSTSWILQYSLPKTATAAQLAAKLDAPYPYNMLRPNFAPTALNADDLLIHGFISAKGKLVDLTVDFPPNFSLAKKILKALSHWRFRPAMLNGAATRVEVLLIIPNDQN